MNILCKYGIHKLKVWYEDDWEICKYCVRCGEEQTISYIPERHSHKDYTFQKKTIQEKRRKKLAKIKMHSIFRVK